ncbi:MAG TPA: Rieske 2Fe-2S domain-containing protein [Terracidiphilus sp.]|nr:Rieske 2Fe-2S domain-containing protein [Terracidiphilus sp.]
MSTPHNPVPNSQPEEVSAPAQPTLHTRRAFLFKLSLLLNGAVGVVLAVPILGYVLGPALKKGSSYRSWVSLGPIDQFPEGETRLADFRNPYTTASDGETGNVACWVRHVQGGKFQVFAVNCAHLGCPVRWFPQSQLFLCPCHGGAYYADGARASGPPERGLFQYPYTVTGNHVLIDAGTMPTLSNEACNQPRPLIQIEPQPPAAFTQDAALSARSREWHS